MQKCLIEGSLEMQTYLSYPKSLHYIYQIAPIYFVAPVGVNLVYSWG